MPFTDQLGLGLAATAYFLAWPTLGSAILILGDPGYERQLKTLESTGALDSEGQRMAEITDSKEMQMRKLREAAAGRSW
eukprot:jgi/Tetstr1/439068/TSEL_027558.t1